MPYPIERKLVVGVSSNALFKLDLEDKIYREEGLEKYRMHQVANKKKVLEKGLAYQFIKRFLNINKVYSEETPVEVVLLSKNSPETGIRIFNSIKEYNLDISRAVFTAGESPYEYIPAYNVSLFLSTNIEDVNKAIKVGYPAGRFLNTTIDEEDTNENELRVAFDFDGVVVDDQSEKVFQKSKELDLFHEFETKNVLVPHKPGPLADFFKKLAFFQKLESKKAQNDLNYKKILKTAIITARSAPSHERAINTLNNWGVEVDKLFLLGGIEKKRILEILKPNIYFDDQLGHLDVKINNIPLVHIPFGITNE